MWDLPGVGLEPVSPALAGRFLTTAPPGKSHVSSFKGCLLLNKNPEFWQGLEVMVEGFLVYLCFRVLLVVVSIRKRIILIR